MSVSLHSHPMPRHHPISHCGSSPGSFWFLRSHIEKREDVGAMGMTYALFRVTEIKMAPDFGSVPPGLYALW